MQVGTKVLFASLALVTATAIGQDMGNYKESETLSIEALSRLRLSVPGDANELFLEHCKRGAVLGPAQVVAASGYNLPIPFSAMRDPRDFCACAIEVAVEANRIAAEVFDVPNPVGGSVSPQELNKASLLPKSAIDENAFGICKAGRWALGLSASGLELHVNGIAYFGGQKQLIAGHALSRTHAIDMSWQDYLRADFGGVK